MGLLPAASIDGEVFYQVAKKYNLGTDINSMNQIVNLVNNGMSPDEAGKALSSQSAMTSASPVQGGLLYMDSPKNYGLLAEESFQEGIRNTDWFKEFVKQYGEEPDLNTKDYNYRKAWQAGIRPVPDPYDNNRYHWSSSLPSGEMLKAANHPTAWKEYYMRITGKNPDEVGATQADYEKLKKYRNK